MSDFKIVKLLDPVVQINTNINPTGVYNPATTYGVGDSVSYGNSSYLCIIPTTGNLPTNTTYWQLLASSATNKLSTTARNQTGVTIPAARVVYFSGVSGNVPTLALSQANTELGSTKTIGITATSIANNSNSEVIVFGLADNLDTSAFTAGSALWLSPTVAGGMTMVEPSAPDHMVLIGFCTRSHPTAGSIEVKIQNGFELEELHNVAIATVSDNQVLKYDAPNSLWKNETLIKDDVGLGNVDNTSDLNKAISDDTQDALDDKANTTLNNLGSTAVNNSINPDSNVTHTLGASGLNWLSVATKSILYDDIPNYDVELRKFIDSGTKDALNYENRHLLDKSAALVLDWENCLIDKDRFDLIGNSFETVSKNLKQYNYALNYSSGVLTTIVYTIPSVGTITKTLNYTSGVLTSIVLSGPTPSSALITKTLNYTSGALTSIVYS